MPTIVYMDMSIAPASTFGHKNVIPMVTPLEIVPSPQDAETLAELSYRSAYRVAYKLLGHREASQDVAVEAVARLIEKKYDDQDFAPSYSARVAARIVISSWRKDAVARKYAPLLTPRATDNMADAATIRLDLRRALKKLTARQREMIVLRYLADFDEKSVAEFLHCSIGTVKSTTHDALARLKTMVEVTP